MSEIKTKIRTYNDVIDLFGEEKAADMLSEALGWSTIDPKNDKKNIMERKPLLLDPYMTYEDEDYCKHIVAGFLGDRDLDWASGYIDEEKIKNGQVMPADLKSALSMALDNELSTSWAYLDALSSQCAEIFNKFAGYIESAGLARGVLVPGEYELDHDALNADVSERFNIQYGFQCDQMIDAMQFDMTLILTEKVDSMDGYRLIQSVCDWREENLEVIEDAENNLDYGKVPSYVAYERPADIGTTIIDELCASQGTAVEKLVNYPTTKFERTMRDELFEDTCGLIIDDSVTFSGYTQNELVDMIGREDNGEDFVITGVGAGHYVGACKKEPSKNKSVSEKTCNARESSGRLDADRNVDRNDIAKDKEVK